MAIKPFSQLQHSTPAPTTGGEILKRKEKKDKDDENKYFQDKSKLDKIDLQEPSTVRGTESGAYGGGGGSEMAGDLMGGFGGGDFGGMG